MRTQSKYCYRNYGYSEEKEKGYQVPSGWEGCINGKYTLFCCEGDYDEIFKESKTEQN